MSSVASRPLTRFIGILLGLLLACAGILVPTHPAAAADGDVAGATLGWGYAASFRGYITGPIAHGSWSVSGGVDATTPFAWSGGSGRYDAGAGTGDVGYPGSVRFTGHESNGVFGLDLTLADVHVVKTGTTTAQLVLDATLNGTVNQDVVFATVNLAAAGSSTSGDTVSYTGAPATITSAGIAAIGGQAPSGGLDPVTFSWPVEMAVAPMATATALQVSPVDESETGSEVTLTATVTPATTGTVQFFDGSAPLGSPVAVAAGVAALATTALAIGPHDLTAVFTPDTSASSGSTSSVVAHTVTAEPDQYLATTTTLTSSTPGPVPYGTALTLTATVAATGATPAGTVTFTSLPASGAAAVTLGEAAVTDGVAELTTASLAFGGHLFRAVYTPVAGFLASEATTTANFGVIDTSTTVCSPEAGAATSTGATASWDYSAYSADWVKSATGNIVVAGSTFELTDGTVTAGISCAQIAFTGSLRVTAYGAYWVELVDPVLTISSAGVGTWSAIVRTNADPSASSRMPVARVTATSGVPQPGATGDTVSTLAYANTVAPGTWAVKDGVAFTGAWANAFVFAVPSAIRAFYFDSGASGDSRKPASPISASFTWPKSSTTSLLAGPAAPIILGTPTTLTATVRPVSATGSVAFVAIPSGGGAPIELGSVAVSSGTARIATTLASGGYTFRAVFTSDNGFPSSTGTTVGNYGVVDASEPAMCTPQAGSATVTDVDAQWDYSAYSSEWTKTASGDITVDGQTFRLSDGVATVADDCVRIAFAGSLRVTAYPTFGGYFVELTDPELVLDADGDGAWVANVTGGTGVAAAPAATPGERVVVAPVSGATRPDFGTDASTTIEFDYVDTTAVGTWSAGYASSWSNSFVLSVPSVLRSFYYQTGALVDGEGAPTLQASKPPATITIGRSAVTPPVAEPASPGSLTWGVKASFRSYITGPIAHGSIALSGGAGSVDGVFWFPQSSSDVDASSGTGSVSYRGTVAFSGHSGALAVRLADPVVRVTGPSTGSLSVATTSGRVDVATLALGQAARSVGTGGAVTYTGAPATLTASGVAVFGGFYAAGTALDPVTFTIGATNSTEAGAGVVAAAARTAANTPDATPPATEGVTTQQTAFTEGGVVTFRADGFHPGESGILAVLYSDPTLLADDLTADATGTVVWTGTLPRGLTGTHTFTFQGSVDRGLVIEIAAAAEIGCPVISAGLDWGFKESFRAYIDGSIANGEWTVAEGASYETPQFSWIGGGGYDTESGDADLAFAGSVRFTGHGGLLDTTVANPRIVIGGGHAVLLLDVAGTTQAGDAVATTGVEFAELDLAAAERAGGGDLVVFTGIPAVLTAAGAAAFGTYPAGEVLDPVDLSITTGPACAEPVVAPAATAAGAETEAGSDAAVWSWIALALALAAIVAFVIIVRRSRQAA